MYRDARHRSCREQATDGRGEWRDSSRGLSVVCNGASAGQRGHRPPPTGLFYHPVLGMLDHTSHQNYFNHHQAHKSEVSNHGGESVLLLTSFLIHTAAAFFTCQIKLPFHLQCHQLVIILYRAQATELGTLSRSVACVHQKGQLDACQCVS